MIYSLLTSRETKNCHHDGQTNHLNHDPDQLYPSGIDSGYHLGNSYLFHPDLENEAPGVMPAQAHCYPNKQLIAGLLSFKRATSGECLQKALPNGKKRRLAHPCDRLDLGIHASLHFCRHSPEVATHH
jgi:hypothetical protein